VPGCLKGIRETLELGVSRKVVSARRQAIISASKARNYGGTESNPGFFRQLVAEYGGGSERLRSQLGSTARSADRAYLDFADFVEDRYLGEAVRRDGCGPDLYQLGCRVFNGIQIDPLQTYEWGWE
jgi:hypothetical protein